MNQIERLILKAKRRVLREENAKWTCAMREVPREQWPAEVLTLSATPLQVWRSRYYLAVLWQEPRKVAQRLSVCRAELAEDGRMLDGLGWDELQEIKSECGFGERDAVEMYPRDGDVVNVANMRHLWILPGLAPFAWRSEQPPSADAVDPQACSTGTPSTREKTE